MQSMSERRTEAAVSLVDFLMGYGNDQEAAFLEILGHICDRGDLNTFCQARGIRVGMLIAWIRRDADRSRRYELALLDRRSLDAEAVRGKWVEVMDAKPEVAPKWSDVLKASEMMGKYSGVLNDGPVTVERESRSEDELREQLLELLERNPDVKSIFGSVGFGGRATDVVDGELTTGVVNDNDLHTNGASDAGAAVNAPDQNIYQNGSGQGTGVPQSVEKTDEEKTPRREVSEQAKAARALRRPKPKAPPVVEKTVVLTERIVL